MISILDGDTHINKLEIGHHILNHSFWTICRKITNDENHVTIPIKSRNIDYIRYIIVVVDNPSDIISLGVSLNGIIIEYTYHELNFLLPLQCDNLYDNETDNMLKSIVRDKVESNKKILFFPFVLSPCDNKLSTKYMRTINLIIKGSNMQSVNIYISLD